MQSLVVVSRTSELTHCLELMRLCDNVCLKTIAYFWCHVEPQLQKISVAVMPLTPYTASY